MADYPDPWVLPPDGVNLNPNPGAEVDAEGVIPFFEYIPASDFDPNAPIPPSPDIDDLVVVRSTTRFHSGVASFEIDKTAPVNRSYKIGVQVDLNDLTIGLGCAVDYWLYLPTGSGGDPAQGQLGLQPMPSIIDPSIPGPEDTDDIDARRVSFSMRADPPIQEGTWLHQQVTFYPTSTSLVFRLSITYNDVYLAPQSFFLDDLVVMQDESFGVEEAPPGPEPEPEPEPPPAIIRPPDPTVICSLDPRSKVTPIVLVAGYNLFAEARAYWWLDTYDADGTPWQIPPDTLANFEGGYATYDDIVTGYREVTMVTRTDGNGITENIQYTYPVPIQNGSFGIMDLDAPMDTWYYYTVTITTNTPATPTWVTTTQPCRINASLFAPEYAGCSAMLLSDPLVPSLAQWMGLTSIDPLSWPGRRELFEVISAQFPIAQADIRLMARTIIRGVTLTLIERQKILDILGTGRILRIRIPDPQYPESNWYISVGTLTENRIFTDHRRPERRWELEIAVVQRPVGIVNSWNYTRDYVTLRDFHDDGVTPLVPKTYDGLRNEYGDYLAALYGRTYSLDVVGLPTGLVYGDGRWPTVQSVETSINWLPELPVP